METRSLVYRMLYSIMFREKEEIPESFRLRIAGAVVGPRRKEQRARVDRDSGIWLSSSGSQSSGEEGRGSTEEREEYRRGSMDRRDEYRSDSMKEREEYGRGSTEEREEYRRGHIEEREEYSKGSMTELEEYGRGSTGEREEYRRGSTEDREEYRRGRIEEREEFSNGGMKEREEYSKGSTKEREEYVRGNMVEREERGPARAARAVWKVRNRAADNGCTCLHPPLRQSSLSSGAGQESLHQKQIEQQKLGASDEDSGEKQTDPTIAGPKMKIPKDFPEGLGERKIAALPQRPRERRGLSRSSVSSAERQISMASLPPPMDNRDKRVSKPQGFDTLPSKPSWALARERTISSHLEESDGTETGVQDSDQELRYQ